LRFNFEVILLLLNLLFILIVLLNHINILLLDRIEKCGSIVVDLEYCVLLMTRAHLVVGLALVAIVRGFPATDGGSADIFGVPSLFGLPLALLAHGLLLRSQVVSARFAVGDALFH
jgi:hypothetical protein